MDHLGFLYYTLCYSIGLPALLAIPLAYARTGDRILRDYLPFLTGVTLQLIAVAVLRYEEAAGISFFPHVNTATRRVYFIVESSLTFTLPYFCHGVSRASRSRLRNAVFGALFLLCVADLLSPLSLSVDPVSGKLQSLSGFFVYRGALFAVILYSMTLLFMSFRAIAARALKTIAVFCIVSVALSLWEMLHCELLPLIHVPMIFPLSPAGYFVTNVLFLAYVIRTHLLPPISLESRGGKSAEQIAREALDARGAKLEALGVSAREKEVVFLLLEGLSLKEIGFRLFISELTVKTHVKSIYRKMDIGNRVQLVNALK